MPDTSQSLAHSRWHGQSHVVCVPQRRRPALCGPMRQALGPILHALARHKACRSLEGPVRPEHVPRGLERPPQDAVASVLGGRTGQSALTSARQLSGRERHCTGEPCGARGSAVSPVGFALEPVRASLRDQEQADDQGRFERCLEASATLRGRPPLKRPHSSSHRLCRGCLT